MKDNCFLERKDEYMNWLTDCDINEIMGDCVLLKEYMSEIVDATRKGELRWEWCKRDLWALEGRKRDLLKTIGFYDGFEENQKQGCAERRLEHIWFSEITSKEIVVACEYCYDDKDPQDAHTWVDVFLVKEETVYRLVEYEMCCEPEDYEFCSWVADTLPYEVRASLGREMHDINDTVIEDIYFN